MRPQAQWRRSRAAGSAPGSTPDFSEYFENGLEAWSGTKTKITVLSDEDLTGTALSVKNGATETLSRSISSAEYTQILFDLKIDARGSDDVGYLSIRSGSDARILNLVPAVQDTTDSLRRPAHRGSGALTIFGSALTVGTVYSWVIDIDWGTGGVDIAIYDGVTLHASTTTTISTSDEIALLRFYNNNEDSSGDSRFDNLEMFI